MAMRAAGAFVNILIASFLLAGGGDLTGATQSTLAHFFRCHWMGTARGCRDAMA